MFLSGASAIGLLRSCDSSFWTLFYYKKDYTLFPFVADMDENCWIFSDSEDHDDVFFCGNISDEYEGASFKLETPEPEPTTPEIVDSPPPDKNCEKNEPSPKGAIKEICETRNEQSCEEDDNDHEDDVQYVLSVAQKIRITKSMHGHPVFKGNSEAQFSALVHAICSGNVNSLEYLLEQGLECPRRLRNTLTSLAASYPHEEISEEMLNLVVTAAKYCSGTTDQTQSLRFPPCTGCREILREKMQARPVF